MEIRPILSALLRSKTAPLLVAIQVAISLAILANSLYIVNLRHASSTRPSGIAAESDVFYMVVRPLQDPTHREAMAQQQRDTEVLAALPGAVSATWISQMPVSRSGSTSGFSLDRKQTRSSVELATYFGPPTVIKTLGLRLVEGRDFNVDDMVEMDDEVDTPAKKFPKSVILAKAVADLLYPGTSAIGKILYYGTGDDAVEMRVVGVVERLQTPPAQTGPAGEHSAILPLISSLRFAKIAVRSEPGQRDRVMADAEAALRSASPSPRIIRTRNVDEDRTNRYRNERALAWMLIGVSALLLLVTASGIVGMTTLRVAQRRKQIGVRRALGARRIDILRYFIVENLLITSGGVIAGIVIAVSLNQLLVGQLELPKLPVSYLVVGAGTLWLLGIIAVYGPAWRAASISPAIATRSA